MNKHAFGVDGADFLYTTGGAFKHETFYGARRMLIRTFLERVPSLGQEQPRGQVFRLQGV